MITALRFELDCLSAPTDSSGMHLGMASRKPTDTAMRTILTLGFLCLLCMLLPSCKTIQRQQFAHFENARHMGQQCELRVNWNGESEGSELPAMVPFAAIAFEQVFSRGYTAKMLAEKAMEECEPDFMLFYLGQPQYAGSVSSGSFVGGVYTGFSVPTYERLVYGLCFRLCPASTGIKIGDNGLVLVKGDAAAAAGILEGDTLLSLGGKTITTGEQWMNSPHYSVLLTSQPGTEIELVWIRPGTGRMSGKMRLQPNPPNHIASGKALTLEQLHPKNQKSRPE